MDDVEEWSRIEKELAIMSAGGETGRRLLIKRWLGCIISDEMDLARHLQEDVLPELPDADRQIAALVLTEVTAALTEGA